MYHRFFVLLTFIGFCIVKKAECAMSQDQVNSMAKGMRKSCTSKVPVDVALLDGAKRGEFSDDTNLKCYMRCVMKMVKGIKNGKIDTNMLVAQAGMMPTNSERMTEVVKKCSEVSSDDECELAFLYVKCMYDTDPETYFFP